MKRTNPSSLRAQRELRTLGANISIARKKRRMTQARLAEGAGVDISTIRRLERGDAGVSLGVLAMTLLTLGDVERLGNLLDMASDDIGLTMEANRLPQRIREKQTKSRVESISETSDEGAAF